MANDWETIPETEWETIPAQDEWEDISDSELRKPFSTAIKHGYRQAGVMMTKQLAGMVQVEAEIGGAMRQRFWSALGRKKPEYLRKTDKTLKEWSEMMLSGVDEYYRLHPEEAIQIEPGLGYFETLEEYITKPEKLAQGLITSVPLILEGILGTITGGAPLAIVAMAMPISGEIYADARKEDTKPLPALAQALLTGVGEAAIEQWTLGRKLGLVKGFRKIVAGGLPKILWEGTKAFFRGTAEEGTQEFNRNFWQWVFTDRSQPLMENVAESAAAGGPMEMVMAGGFATAGAVGPMVSKEQKISRIEKIRAMVNEADLNEQQKKEIAVELDRATKEVKTDVYEVRPIPEVEPTPEPEAVTPVERVIHPDAVGNIVEIHNKTGGATIDLKTGKSVTEGFAVAIPESVEESINSTEITEEQVEAYRKKYANVLAKDENRTVGVWVENGKSILDISTIAKTKTEAMRIAKESDQRAIHNLKTHEDIAVEPAPTIKAIKPRKLTRRKLLAMGHKYPQQLEMTEKERRNFMEGITGLRSMKTMSYTQMKDVTDALREEAIARGIEPDTIQLEQYGEPIVVNDRATTMEEVIDESVDVLNDLPTKIKTPEHIHKRFFKKIRRTSLARRLGRLFWGIDNSPLYELINILEQGKPGILTEVFDDNIQQGRSIAAGHKRTVSIAFRNFSADNNISDGDLAKISESTNARMFHGLLETLHRGTTIHTVEINKRKYDMTPAELLDVYLIARQEDGLRHIYGGGLVINGVKTGKISGETLTGLFELVSKNDKLMQLADIISQVENKIWKPTINNTSMALDGKKIAKVENWWGLEVLMPKQLAGKIRKFNVNLTENKSILKDRTKASNPLIIRDALQRFTAFENAVSDYVGMASVTRTARTVLNDENFNELLRSKGYGPLRNNMHLILERAQSTPPTSGSFDRLLGGVIPGIYRSVLFFNPRVVMSQYTSVTNYQAFVSAKYATLVTKGLTPEAIKRTLEISDIAWDRFYMGHSSLELGELAASDATLRLLTQTSADKNKLGITLRLADIGALATGTEIAIAEYKDAQAEKITGESAIYWADKDVSFKEESSDWNQAIAKRAEWLWHRSQPSWDKWSRSAITSDPSAIKRLFFLFRSFHEKSLTILHGTDTEYRNSNKTLEDKVRFSKKYGAVLSGYALNNILRAVIMAGLARKVKDPFDYLKDLITAPFRMLPILGHIIDGSIRSFVNVLIEHRSEYRGETIESLPVEVINQISRSPQNFTRAVGYYLNNQTEEGNQSLKKAVGQLYMGIGLAMGVPVYEINRLYKGWIKEEKLTKRATFQR